MSTFQSHIKNKKYVMLKDFDILAMHDQDQQSLYQAANFQTGIQMMKSTYIRDQNGQKYSILVSIQEFKKYGPGIYLLFLLVKQSIFLFLVLSILSFINLGVVLSGNQINIGFQVNMAKTTIANVQIQKLPVIIAFDYIMTVLIFIAIIVWKEKQATYVVDCCKQVMLPSYQTIVLKKIPQLYTEEDMKIFLEERFGEIQDIYTVRNFNDDLYHYKQITKIIADYTYERALVKTQAQRSPIKLAKLFFQYQKYYFLMQKTNLLSKYPKQFAFITFKSVKSRQEMLKFYQRTFPQLQQQKKQYYLYKSQQLKMKACLMQPNGIIWQNLNIQKKQRYMWKAIQICLLILVLFISIIVIFILYITASSMSNSQYSLLTKKQILSLNSNQALQSYCLNLSLPNFNQDADCNDFSSLYVKNTIFFLGLPLTISIFKFLLTQIMKALVSLRRHPYQISKLQSQTLIMFVFYFFASGVLQYIAFLQVQINGTSFSFVNIVRPIQNALTGYWSIDISRLSLSPDYTRTWYLIASSKIILIAMISFNVSSVGKVVYSYLRKWFCQFYARKQCLQIKLNYWIEGEQMEIQFVYAVVATIVCFLMMFSAPMPLLYPFTCMSLFVFYWSIKFIFINFCAKPHFYSHSMNSLIVKILLWGIALHSLVTPLYFGAATIHSELGVTNFLRIPYFGYYIALMVAPILYMLQRQRFANFLQKIRNYYKQANDQDFIKKRSKKMSLPSKLCLIDVKKSFHSKNMTYSMHQNPIYQCILKSLYTINKQQRVRASCVLNKQLQNLLQKDQFLGQSKLIFNSSPPNLFKQLLDITKKSYDNFQGRVGKKYSKSNNPYKLYLNQLEQVEKSTKNNQYDGQQYEIEIQNFKSISLKSLDLAKLKDIDVDSLNFDHLKNLRNLRKKIYSRPHMNKIIENSQEDQVSRKTIQEQIQNQQPPTSDLRLNYRDKHVSKLAIISSVGLSTIQKISPNEKFFNDQLIKDQMDYIKQTQSFIDDQTDIKTKLNQNSFKQFKFQGQTHETNKIQKVRFKTSKSKKEQIFAGYKRTKKPIIHPHHDGFGRDENQNKHISFSSTAQQAK